MVNRGVLLAFAALALLPLVGAGAQPAGGMGPARQAGIMQVAVNKSQVLRIDRPYAKVLIGNAEIADVTPMTATSVYVLGKRTGSTNLTLYDQARNLITVVDLVVGPDADGLKRQLYEMMPGEHVGVRVANDALVLDGRVTSPGAADRIAQLAETYAPTKVVNMMTTGAPQQVLLEVRFSEMQRNTSRALGIRTLSFSNNFAARSGPTLADTTFGTPTTSVSGNFNIGPVNIQLALDALEARGLSTTLAEPNLVALSGETASFLAGGEFPIPIASNSSGGSNPIATITVEFKQFGALLAFTPTVLEDGMINLVLSSELSAIDTGASITLSNITIPGLKTRKAKTTLELHDGESFAMAGLISNNFTDSVKEVPLLGRLPIIGALFRSTGFQRGETELVITVTPRLVKATLPDRIVLPTELTSAPSDADLLLRGITERAGRSGGVAAPTAGQPGGIDGPYGHIVR